MMKIINQIKECTGGNSYADFDVLEYCIVHRFGWSDIHKFSEKGVSKDAVGVANFYLSNPEANKATGGVMPYQFVISHDGTIYQGRKFYDASPHARRFSKEGIGVALLGDFNEKPPTREQFCGLVDFLSLVLKFLPQIKIVGHTELPGSTGDPRKICPGGLLDTKKAIEIAKSINKGEAKEQIENLGIQF